MADSTVERARAIFQGKLVLAPMTKGSNTPFRRLCRELGCDVTVGEMAIAFNVVRKKRGELALLRTHPEDHPFGAQLADREPRTLADAARVAEDMGADFVDLNCGCPIDAFTQKGLGAALLRRPNKIAGLVRALKSAVKVPVTVKLRLGWAEGEQNFLDVARAAVAEGADAIALHARTREQRYARAANWQRVRELKEAVAVPVIGNGDLLAHWEVEDRWNQSGADAVMFARGALIKPWVFREAKEKRTIPYSAAERLALLYRYVALADEHFGADALGRSRTREFLLFHLGFMCRYRPLVEGVYRTPEYAHPLLQTRMQPLTVGDPLEVLLARTDEAGQRHLAAIALGEAAEDQPAPAPAAADGPAAADADAESLTAG